MNTNMTSEQHRVIVLDTETTGMNQDSGPHYLGHRVIEIGAVELINRKSTGRHFHVYLKPDRSVDPEAIQVHGITDEFLRDKPNYASIHDEFIAFIQGAELVAHNAPFDVGFLNHEFELLSQKSKHQAAEKIANLCHVTDTLALAKKIFPGKRNNLDALCQRYGIDNTHRTLHGALLDAEILADVYLLMTGGQTTLNFDMTDTTDVLQNVPSEKHTKRNLKIIPATADELKAHHSRLDLIESVTACLWR